MRKHTNNPFTACPPPLPLLCAVPEPPSPLARTVSGLPTSLPASALAPSQLPVPHPHVRGSLLKQKSDYATPLLKTLPDAPLGPQGPRDQAPACLAELISLIRHTPSSMASLGSPDIPSSFRLGALVAQTGHSSWNALSLDCLATGSFLPFRFQLKRHLLREASPDDQNVK